MIQKIEVRVSARGIGKVIADGVEIPGVATVVYTAKAGLLPRLTLQLVAEEIEITGEAEVAIPAVKRGGA